MHSRWFNYAVVLLWLAAMGWLVVAKVLPPLLVGEPPNYHTILEAQRQEPLVGWALDFNDRPLGWALSTAARRPDQVMEIRSRVHFGELPLDGLLPPWLQSLLKVGKEAVLPIPMDVESTLLIDPLEGLERFDSVVRIEGIQDAIVLRGTINGTQLRLDLQSGSVRHTTKAYLPPDALLGDAFSPQTQLPGLRRGQRWTVPAYSPLRPLHNPLEILEATVEGRELVTWGGRLEETWLVVYRQDPGLGLGGNEKPRGRLWVRRDGTVLRQQVMILDSVMTFQRLPGEEAAALAQRAGIQDDNGDWMTGSRR